MKLINVTSAVVSGAQRSSSVAPVATVQRELSTNVAISQPAEVVAPSSSSAPGPSSVHRPDAGAGPSSSSLAAGPSRVHRASAKSNQRSGKAEKLPRSASRPDERPSWVPGETVAWERALSNSRLGDEGEFPKTYHLPPPFLFFTLGGDGEGAIARIHNWLRIRRWCISQVVDPAFHGMVLMSASEWRIALLGEYYQVRHEAGPDEDAEVAAARATEIARLPPNPRAEQMPKRLTERDLESGPPTKKPRVVKENSSGKKQRALAASRGIVNVRFGLYGQFVPYDKTFVAGWRSQQLTFEPLRVASNIWAEVVWELSVLNFRLELLQLDRHYCSEQYAGLDGGFARSQTVAAIWGDDGMIAPDWSGTVEGDCLCSPRLDVQVAALQRFANVLSAWPGGSVLEPLTRKWPVVDGDVTLFAFYVPAAHGVLNRLPTTPLCQPASMLLNRSMA